MKFIFLSVLFMSALSSSLASSKLIGGRPAEAQEYMATVQVGGCTAAKVALRAFLIAAHCVTDSDTGGVRSLFRPMSRVKVKTHYGINETLTVESTHPHPSYLHELRKRIEADEVKFGIALTAFDAAIFKVAEETPAISLGSMSYEKVLPPERILIGGWGCEEAVGKEHDSSLAQYKVAESKVVSLKAVPRDYNRRDVSRVESFNFLSAGIKLDAHAASICPGDSGGPAYRMEDGAIVGVNSQYLFKDNSGISVVNTHTRLSEITEWVQSLTK